MRIALRVLLGYFVIVAMTGWLLSRVFVQEVKPGVRQAMEDTLADTANVLAELATDDFLAGRIDNGQFAERVRAVSRREIGADIWGFDKDASSYRVYVTDARGRVVFDSSGRDVGRDYSRWNDVYLTLRGRYGARSTRIDPEDETSTVMHVAAPIRDKAATAGGAGAGRIVGVLTVAKPNQAIAPFIARSQEIVLRWGLLLLGCSLLIGVAMAWWMSRQIGRLRDYANAVTAGERVPAPRAAGEFGELGTALEVMRERLEGKQYVEQYVHALTHELKSPLTAIRGSVELLEPVADAPVLPEQDRRRFIATIREQAERMAQMIDKLLSLAAVEYRQHIEEPELVAVRTLFEKAAEQMATRLSQADVALEVTVPDAGMTLRGDPFLLQQAIVNLLDNAVDFSPAGSRIVLAAQGIRDSVDITVADNGPGIPDYAASRVFDRFYSLPRPAGGSRSSGLGLAFVAQVAELHGGRASLCNRETGGALATLELPAA